MQLRKRRAVSLVSYCKAFGKENSFIRWGKELLCIPSKVQERESLEDPKPSMMANVVGHLDCAIGYPGI